MPTKTYDIINALDKHHADSYNYDTSFGILKSNTKLEAISNIFPRIE